MELQELSQPACVPAGGSHIDEAFRDHLKFALSNVLQEDPLNRIEGFTDQGMQDFQDRAKPRHTYRNQELTVNVAERALHGPDWGILRGSMHIPS